MERRLIAALMVMTALVWTSALGLNPEVREVDIDVDSDHDGKIDTANTSFDDQHEMSEGGIVCVGGWTNIILQQTLSKVQPGDENKVRLSWSNLNVLVSDTLGGNAITPDHTIGDIQQKDYFPSDLPKMLWVKGINPSPAKCAEHFRLEALHYDAVYDPNTFDEVAITVVKVELRYSSSTHWLVIEDKDSTGAGDDISSKPVQHAENIAKIEYAILPQGGMPPQEVTLEIVGTAYKQLLSLDTGVKQTEIETKNGKLKVDSNTWLPSTAGDCFPSGDYRLRLTVKFTSYLTCTSEYEGTELLTIKPLMQKLKLTPDITVGRTLCPYFDKVIIGATHGYGEKMQYDLLDDLGDLTVEVTGGDTGGTKSLKVGDSSKKTGADLIGKWEGYDSTVDEKFDEILGYPNEMPRDKRAPPRVVKEADGYKLTIKMTRGADSTQKQSFEIPFTVEYKSN